MTRLLKSVSPARLGCMTWARWMFATVIASFSATSVQAAGSNMPWEVPLQQVLDSLQGPVVQILAVAIIILTGLALAFGDMSGGFRRLLQIVFGISIAFAASSFFLTFFGFTGGALVA